MAYATQKLWYTCDNQQMWYLEPTVWFLENVNDSKGGILLHALFVSDRPVILYPTPVSL